MAGIAPGTTVLGRYVMMQHVHGTRLTDIYRAKSTSSNEEVLVKVLRRGVGEVVSQRFEREARMMSVIMHPNVVRLHTYGVLDGNPCLVMEAIDGERLDRIIAREGAIAWPEALKWTIGLLSGLEAVHAAQVVHRDVAPANIVITSDGKTKLANLDLATMVGGATAVTTGGEVLGIPHYIAPERALHGQPATSISDVFSAGATMYHMITGRVPFAARNFQELTSAFATTAPPPISPPGFPPLPAEVQTAVLAAIEVEPGKRTRSARQFASALRAAHRTSGVHASSRPRRRTSRSRVTAAPAPPPQTRRRTIEAQQPADLRGRREVSDELDIGATPPAASGYDVLIPGDQALPPPPADVAPLDLALGDEPLGYGAYGEGPPPDATHIPGARPVGAPAVPGGTPQVNAFELELEPDDHADTFPGGPALEVAQHDLLGPGPVTGDAAGWSAPASTSQTTPYAGVSDGGPAGPPSSWEGTGWTPDAPMPPPRPKQTRKISGVVRGGPSAPALGLRSSGGTGPHRPPSGRHPTLPPTLTATGPQPGPPPGTGPQPVQPPSPYAVKQSPPFDPSAEAPAAPTAEPVAGAARGHYDTEPERASDDLADNLAGHLGDDDLPIDYSGPSPDDQTGPLPRNQRFTTGSSTLRRGTPMPSRHDLPADVELPPLRQTYTVLACRSAPPAPPAQSVGPWLGEQLRGRGGVRVLNEELFVTVLPADNTEHGRRLAEAVIAALGKAFGNDIAIAWELGNDPALERVLRPSGTLPPLVEDLLGRV